MSPLPRRGDRWKRKSTQETTSGITNPRSRHEAAQDLSMRKYEKYPLSPITGLIPQGDESGNVPQNVTPKTGRVKFEIRHPKFAMSMIPHSEFRIPHWVRTLNLEPFVHSAFRIPHSAFDWYLAPQPGRGDSKLSKPDPTAADWGNRTDFLPL